MTFAQLNCNVETKIVAPSFSSSIVSQRTGLIGLAVGSIANAGNVVNNDTDDYASINITLAVAGTATLSVASGQQFDAGHLAGFEISSTNLLNVDLLGGISIRTYLNGVEQETSNANNLLLNVGALGGTSRGVMGFITTKPFDEVQFRISTLLNLNLLGSTRIHNMIVKKLCLGSAPSCNVDTRIVAPTYPAVVQQIRTGTGGVTVASISNSNNVVNSDINDYASINITAAVAGTATLSVASGQQFNAGYFAGFEISNANLLNVNLLGGISIRTYLNGVEQETSTSNSLLLNVGVLGSAPRSVVGFVTTKPFDEVQFRMSTLLSVDLLGETRIYNMIVKQFCEGPAFACNTNTLIGKNQYPVSIGNNTGVTGIATVGNIVDIDHILDNDPLTYASINIPVGALSTATIAIHKQLTPFSVGAYVSFDVEFTSLINVAVLPKLKLRLLRNNAQVGIIEGSNFLLGANVATNIRKTLGFKAPAAFDEIQLIYEQPVGISLGTIKIYDLYLLNPCQNPIDCSTNHPIENTPTHPVVINQFKTGLEGIVCALCSVSNSQNLISPSTTDYATLSLGIGVAGKAGISVLDLTNIYPTGTNVGFTIADVVGIVKLDLLETFFIKTYLNGNLQETIAGTDLLDLSLLGIINVGTGQTNYGFKTTKPFNEVKFEISSLASVINTINIYNLKIDVSNPTANDGNLICQNNVCVKQGDFSTAGIPSTGIGISSLASPRSTWPADVPNGFVVLESKDKGFVISRVSNPANVLQPQEGMLIYDTSASCIKLYNGATWKCISKSCNE
ncbi:hypothetical protein [Empedobacter falsenii]|uniref:Uncharacterized protein n=1 Tax=Empedobacter falsenii TaxID=343874 RepID=A0A7H9DS18_9FLAO|nr:hypothetical protein [Empedobacter falsenii]QLL57840.1 hypothetical protein FH779_07005 [Empedobacter falsenii]